MTKEANKTQLSKAEREAYALVGRIGGKATVRKHGRDYMSKIGKKAAKARWRGHKKKTAEK